MVKKMGVKCFCKINKKEIMNILIFWSPCLSALFFNLVCNCKEMMLYQYSYLFLLPRDWPDPPGIPKPLPTASDSESQPSFIASKVNLSRRFQILFFLDGGDGGTHTA